MEDIEGLRKKNSLTIYYYNKISKLEKERRILNKKLAGAKSKFQELLTSNAYTEQLEIFEDLDQFLIDIEKESLEENN